MFGTYVRHAQAAINAVAKVNLDVTKYNRKVSEAGEFRLIVKLVKQSSNN